MSDLSNLLGDVYGDHSPDAAPVRREPSAEQRLVEGPGDLTAAAAALATPVAPAPMPVSVVEDVPLPTLAQALDEAPAAPVAKAAWTSSAATTPTPTPSAVPTTVSAPAAGGFWRPGDDDILPLAKGAKKARK